ncbi:MAG: glycosyltransferase family A protein [Sneathiella sp.]
MLKNSKEINGTFDVAVVIPTIVRPSLLEAVQSIFEQKFTGTIQILVGVDKVLGDQDILYKLFENIPDKVTITLFDPQYSTSARHGGIHQARDGGSLRTTLSFLANSRYVAYLDDDNLFHPNHLETLLKAVVGVDWAYSYRWLVDEETNKKLTVDKWHSAGPNNGIMKGTSGGFADPNTLLIDKLACADQLHLWSVESDVNAKFSGADRMFFNGLSLNKTYNSSKRATVYYKMRRTNILWQYVNREARDKEKQVS